MSRERRKRDLEAAPASTFAFWALIVNGFFALLFLAAGVGFVALIYVGWWASASEVLVAVVLILAAIVGFAFFVDGIRRDLRGAGWSARGELREVGRRFRRRPGGREQFAPQRFTGNARRRR